MVNKYILTSYLPNDDNKKPLSIVTIYNSIKKTIVNIITPPPPGTKSKLLSDQASSSLSEPLLKH